MILDKLFQYLPGRFAARLIGRMAGQHIKNEEYPTLLVLNRGRLAHDIQVLIETAPMNFITIKALRSKAMQSRFVTADGRVQTMFHQLYVQGDGQRRERMQNLVREMMDSASRGRKIDGVIAANVEYWPDEAVKDICQDRNIPFLVLCRENYAFPDSGEYLRNRFQSYDFQFRGTAIAMASEASRDAMIHSQIVPPDVVECTGWPRFDHWLEEPQALKEKIITLVDYSHPQYFAVQNANDVLQEFLAAAKKYRGQAKFVIKFKRYNDLWRVVWDYPGFIFAGVKLVARGPIQPLLEKSTVVIGSGSMGIVEAFLADSAVVIPWWADSIAKERGYFSPDVPEDLETAYFPKSRSELANMIEAMVAGQLPPKGARGQRFAQFRRYAAIDENEPASVKVTRFVKRHIQ